MKKTLLLLLATISSVAQAETALEQAERMRLPNPELDKILQEREYRKNHRIVILSDDEYQELNPFKGEVQTYNSGQHATFIKNTVKQKNIWGSTLQSNIKKRANYYSN